jgi:hypothetical protein
VSRQARGYDAAYQRERAGVLGRPCEIRLPGCTEIATTADYTRALRDASRAKAEPKPAPAAVAEVGRAKADAAPATGKSGRPKPETKAEKAMRVPIVRTGQSEVGGAESQAALRERVRANGGSLPANAEAEPPAPRNGRRSKADEAVETAVSELAAGLEAQAADEITREPETLGVNRGERERSEEVRSPSREADCERTDVAALLDRGWKQVTPRQRAVLDEVLDHHTDARPEWAAAIIRSTPAEQDPLAAVMTAERERQRAERERVDREDAAWRETKEREAREAKEAYERLFASQS